MSPDNFNTNEFQHSIILNASGDQVFRMITEREGLCKWFLGEVQYSSGKFPKIGDDYTWKWKTKDFTSGGKVLDVQYGKSMKFTFGENVEVIFKVEPSKNRSRFSIYQYYTSDQVQSDFFHINCCVCWVFFMTNLKSVLEHGIDLRETQVIDEEMVNQ